MTEYEHETPIERQVREEIEASETAESEDRPIADWLAALGPEDLDRDEVMEQLQDYGFDILDEDDYVSNPTAPHEMPDWAQDDSAPTGDEVGETLAELPGDEGGEYRALEDEVLDAVDENRPADPEKLI